MTDDVTNGRWSVVPLRPVLVDKSQWVNIHLLQFSFSEIRFEYYVVYPCTEGVPRSYQVIRTYNIIII